MNCEEKSRLGAEYEAGARKFAEAVAELQRRMGTCSKTEYESLNRAADEARLKSEQARIALEQHIVAHRC